MTAYKDLGKESKDLLNQNFLSSNSITLSGTYKSDNGITYKETVKRTLKKDFKTKTTSPAVEVLVEPKYESYPFEINAKFSTMQDLSGSLIYKDFISKGSKIEINTTKTDRDGVVAKLDASYKSEGVSGSIVCSYPFPSKKTVSPIKVVGDMVFGYNRVLCGLSTIAEVEPTATNLKTEGTFATVAKDNQLTGRVCYVVKDQAFSWGIAFIHRLSTSLAWALGYDIDSKGPVVSLAFENKFEKDSTLKIRSLIKNDSTATTDWRLGLSLKQKKGSFATYIVSADFNLRQFIDSATTGDGHSFGFDLKLE